MAMSWVLYIAILTLFHPLLCLKEIICYILDDEMPFILFAMKIAVSRAQESLEVNESPWKGRELPPH